MKYIIHLILIFGLLSIAKAKENILINTDLLDHQGIKYFSNAFDLAVVPASLQLLNELSHHAHDFHRCGGYEVLGKESPQHALNQLQTEIYNSQVEALNLNLNSFSSNIEYKTEIYTALQSLDPKNLEQTVVELS